MSHLTCELCPLPLQHSDNGASGTREVCIRGSLEAQIGATLELCSIVVDETTLTDTSSDFWTYKDPKVWLGVADMADVIVACTSRLLQGLHTAHCRCNPSADRGLQGSMQWAENEVWWLPGQLCNDMHFHLLCGWLLPVVDVHTR